MIGIILWDWMSGGSVSEWHIFAFYGPLQTALEDWLGGRSLRGLKAHLSRFTHLESVWGVLILLISSSERAVRGLTASQSTQRINPPAWLTLSFIIFHQPVVFVLELSWLALSPLIPFPIFPWVLSSDCVHITSVYSRSFSPCVCVCVCVRQRERDGVILMSE